MNKNAKYKWDVADIHIDSKFKTVNTLHVIAEYISNIFIFGDYGIMIVNKDECK